MLPMFVFNTGMKPKLLLSKSSSVKSVKERWRLQQMRIRSQDAAENKASYLFPSKVDIETVAPGAESQPQSRRDNRLLCLR